MIEEIVAVTPRGFCAGVARSIRVVDECLRIFGEPVYIKHAIVHNQTVVADLEKKGAITVENVSDIPDGAVAVFSAHGSPPTHFAEARARGIRIIDATCPLVAKVHMEMHKFLKEGYHVVYIGHKGHVEGLGVIGEAVSYGQDIPVLEDITDVEQLTFGENEQVAVLTQTTLSVDETTALLDALRQKYPKVMEPPAQDICYATTNRQKAIRVLAESVDVIIVVGSQTSSNSKRLQETAQKNGCPAYLIDSVEEIDNEWLKDAKRVGITAGASAPEYKVQEIIAQFVDRGAKYREIDVAKENMHFTEPIELIRAKKNM